MQDQEIKIFIAYAYADRNMVKEVEKDLKAMKRHTKISWSGIDVDAGEDLQEENQKNLNAAHIILLMISRDFLASDYCYDQQIQQAVARHDKKAAVVIPVILSTCDWKDDTPFRKLTPLPENGKPVQKWNLKADAYTNIKRGIQKVVERLQKQPPSGNIIQFPAR